MDPALLPPVALVLFVAGALQGAVGFAFALFATPLLVWSGMGLTEAVAVVAVASAGQVATATLRLWREVPWRWALPAAGLRLLALPLGIALLLVLDGLEPARVRQVLGVVVLAALAAQLLARSRGTAAARPGPPRRRWMLAAFGASGLMQGMVGMGGPAAVLWTLARPWSSRRSRAFLAALMLLGAPAHLGLLLVSTGGAVGGSMLTGLLVVPVVAAGTVLGVAAGDRLGRSGLRRAALTLLGASALASMAGPLLG